MKFTVDTKDLLDSLKIGQGAIASNPVIPIIEDFLFTIKGKELVITTTDLQTSVRSTLAVNSEEDMQIAIPSKILTDTLKALPRQPVEFVVSDSYGIKIKSKHGTYKIAGENAEDFPAIPELIDTRLAFKLDADTLLTMLNRTLFATGNDDLRPAMTGVNIEAKDGKLVCVSTDAHKLSKHTIDVEATGGGSFVIPKKALSLLKSVVSNGEVEVSIDSANAVFEIEGTTITCRLVDARFPDYEAVMPTANEKQLRLSLQDLRSAVNRILIFANKATSQVVFDIEKERLTISAQDIDLSNEGSEVIPCNWMQEEKFRIAFNGKFLLESLRVLDSEDIVLLISTPTRAAILEELDKVDGENTELLLMPMMLSN